MMRQQVWSYWDLMSNIPRVVSPEVEVPEFVDLAWVCKTWGVDWANRRQEFRRCLDRQRTVYERLQKLTVEGWPIAFDIFGNAGKWPVGWRFCGWPDVESGKTQPPIWSKEAFMSGPYCGVSLADLARGLDWLSLPESQVLRSLQMLGVAMAG